MTADIYHSFVSQFASTFPESKFYKRDRSSDREIYRLSRRNGAKSGTRSARLKASQKQSMESVGKLCGENSRLCFVHIHTHRHMHRYMYVTLDRLPRVCLS